MAGAVKLRTNPPATGGTLDWVGVAMTNDGGGGAGAVVIASGGAVVGAGNPLPTSSTMAVPAAANVVGGATQADAVTLVTIPANRTFQGWIAIQGTLLVAAGGGVAAGNARVDTVGAGALPFVGSLARIDLSLPAVAVAVTPVSEEASQAIFVTVQAPAGGCTIVSHTAGLTVANMSAVGILL